MPLSIPKLELFLPPFLMVLFRVGGIAIAAPLFSSQAIPARIKAAMALVMSLMIFPVVYPLMPASLELNVVLSSVAGELLIGLLIGTAAGLTLVGAQLAGMVIGQQAGIALGEVVNPMLEGSSTIIAQMYFLVAFMVFLAVGGHRATVTALLDTFHTIPPGSFRFEQSMLELVERLLSSAFVLAIRFAGPALIALFLASLTMGVISRTIPQINVLTIGFAVRVFVGLSVAGLSLPLIFELLDDAIADAFQQLRWTMVGTG